MKRSKGFSLIELMIVIAVIAIIAAIALPSYQESVKKTRRSDAQGALLGFAQAMERFYTDNGTYVGAAGTVGTPTATGAPFIFSTKSPVDGGITYYNLKINAAAAASYTLYAEPVNAQAGNGNLGLKSTGRRGWDKNTNDDPFDAGETCWKSSCD